MLVGKHFVASRTVDVAIVEALECQDGQSCSHWVVQHIVQKLEVWILALYTLAAVQLCMDLCCL